MALYTYNRIQVVENSLGVHRKVERFGTEKGFSVKTDIYLSFK